LLENQSKATLWRAVDGIVHNLRAIKAIPAEREVDLGRID